VKSSGRDEPVWVATHRCMEAALGISVYSYLYLKLAKMLCLFHYLLSFLFNKIEGKEGGAGSAWKRRGEVARTMYTHVSKCKSYKLKKERESYLYREFHYDISTYICIISSIDSSPLFFSLIRFLW
jgi:hypothetical protein